MSKPVTHLQIDRRLCGSPRLLEEGRAEVHLTTIAVMAVDGRGLVHGGFVFGLADHAAMLAVNDPNVVLGSADVRFTAPVSVGDALVARARVDGTEGRRRAVTVEVDNGDSIVLTGMFSCFVLDQHVLER
ncbi:MAG: thioesterase [Gammaproteobacteria bacterium]|nr:thioesterase [Gammaproteobacteria bacterium]